MTDLPEQPVDASARGQQRERFYERMEPGEVTIDREPVGGPVPQLTPEELRDLGIDPV
ncbi:hypothetical protein OWR29_25525 [Actinoplanes sp. Pm04-4]|uniref:Uncharacterized protein n=1 Tax=Paractinoplanes pyxinae TaxID=2997416 RepID=A0ABT4B6Z8_9ACTN|nr:hypothetical protein [Actinoplanes pyxinae]MCY1141373.1 hypothetical protein [Actinoplanes pyxinae]